MECAGVGLHSGAPVNLRILPAPAGSGIVFRRVDLDGFEVEAISRNVARVSYATSLMKKGVLISTTEHLLSAFIGTGIDNAIVELDNLELPILDGSARPFVELIQQSWNPQAAASANLPSHPPRAGSARGQQIYRGLSGGNLFRFLYHRFSASAYRQGDFQRGTFQRQLLPRDRACPHIRFAAGEQKMRNMGLIRGASRENALCSRNDGVENPPLRFDDEFVRHKVLDLIGDLALLGKQILGNVVADRAGHAMHTALVSRLLRDRTLWEETTVEDQRDPVVPSVRAMAGQMA